ncbi:MAG: TRAP transporter substrate-binding protein [Peptostreptococcaceae bacterium]|nr:TRAP transporter substrate-binding protein [Peptostreptococcaceae bacterium]
MKKLLILAISLIMLVSLTACGSSSDDSASAEEPVVIHFASTVSTTHDWYISAQTFKDTVEKESNGSIEVVIDFGGVLGSDKEIVEGVAAGTVDMSIDSTVGIDAVVTELGFVNLPYLMTSYDEVDELFYDGWIGEKATELAEAKGIKVLGWTDCDFRWMTNSVRPIESVDDLAGMKLRVPESPMYLAFFKALGCTPTPIAFTDLPSALQQGVVDGQDNGPVLTYTANLYQFQKYMTKSNHSFAAAGVLFNPAKWDSMSAEQQTIVQDAADKYVTDVKTAVRASVISIEADMTEEGVTIIETTPELDASMRAAAEKVWQDEEVTQYYDQDAVAKILKDAGLN